MPAFLQHLYTIVIVIIGWVFFRADNISIAIVYIKKMFSSDLSNMNNTDVLLSFNAIWVISFIIAIISSTPVLKNICEKIFGKNEVFNKILYIGLFAITILYMVGLTYNPFIYFKF